MVKTAVMMALAAIAVMWLLYAVGIQYLRGGWWRFLVPITVVAAVLDVLLNYSLFAAMTLDWPRRGELTFSQRLNRLVTNADWRGRAARWTAKYMLDWIAPGGRHIYPKGQV